ALLLLVQASAAHGQATITGRVTDGRSLQPLSGVMVEVEGLRLTAVGDADGRYLLQQVPAGTHTVVARLIGYTLVRQTVTVPAEGRVTLDFELQIAPIALDEVVVTGAGEGARLRTIGNSVATISAPAVQELAQTPNFTSLLL